jgi:hypothetical protein
MGVTETKKFFGWLADHSTEAERQADVARRKAERAAENKRAQERIERATVIPGDGFAPEPLKVRRLVEG